MFWNNSEQEEHNYWISYTDLVMGLLMAFIVVSMVLFSRDSEKAALDGKYSELVTAFKEKFKDNEGIEVTDDATIRFVLNRTKAKELFTSGDYHPTDYTNKLLEEFIPAYFDEILDIYQPRQDSFEIKELRIEGHTDSEGTYYNNLHFSSGRAVKIQSLILQDQYFQTYPKKFQEFVQQNSIACGYSFSRLLDADGNLVSKSEKEEDRDRSRRVEFRVILEYIKR